MASTLDAASPAPYAMPDDLWALAQEGDIPTATARIAAERKRCAGERGPPAHCYALDELDIDLAIRAGRPADAQRMAEAWLADVTRHFPAPGAHMARAKRSLGEVLMRDGNVARALPLIAHAYDIQLSLAGTDPDDIDYTQNLLLAALAEAGQPPEGDRRFDRAIDRAEATGDDQLPFHLLMRGQYHLRLTEFAAAETALRRSIRLIETRGGDPRILGLGQLLFGITLASQDKCRPALPYLTQALADFDARPADPNPFAATMLIALAQCHREAGDATMVEPLLARATTLLNREAPEAIAFETLQRLAATLMLFRDTPDGDMHFKRLLALFERMMGPEHPSVAALLGDYGDLLRERGKPDESAPLYRRAVAIADAALPPGNPIRIKATADLAVLELEHGRRPAVALVLFRKAAAGLDMTEARRIDDAGHGRRLRAMAQLRRHHVHTAWIVAGWARRAP